MTAPRRWRFASLLPIPLILGVMATACAPTAPSAIGPSGAAPATQTMAPPATRSMAPPPPEPTPTARRTWPPVPVHELAPASPSPASPQPDPPWGGIPGSLVGTQWYRLPTSQRVVALTFDAGANADAVPSILATLERYGVPGTFFLTGRWVEAYPQYAAQIGGRYPVANHSYSHPDLTTLSDPAVTTELRRAAGAIRAATGRDTRPMFRFPFGAATDHLVDVVNGLGYGAINWTVDTRGWQGTSGGQSQDLIVQRVVDALQPGEIVIMHVGSHPTDGSTLDADALPRVIEELRGRGYGFVTVDQFL